MASAPPAASIRGVSKKFCRDGRRALRYGVRDILRELSGARRNGGPLRPGEFWALDRVSFDLGPGECVGLVGANGTGKTTLLKIVSGLLKPDAGEVSVRGRVAPLLALGAGFIPALTGRENVEANLAILGLGRVEVREAIPRVIDFAEIGDALDAPLATYSSGMAARLGFACAVHTRPDVLIVDEVLSVGDMRFRAKCHRRIATLRENGAAILMVTHNANAVISMCDRVAYLREGELAALGDPAATMARFERDLFLDGQGETDAAIGSFVAPPGRGADGPVSIRRVSLRDEGGREVGELRTGLPGTLRVECAVERRTERAFVGVILRDLSDDETVVLNLSGERDGALFDLDPGSAIVDLDLPRVGLRPGLFTAKVFVASPPLDVHDAVESIRFRVTSDRDLFQCAFDQPRRWSCRAGDARRRFEPAGTDAA